LGEQPAIFRDADLASDPVQDVVNLIVPNLAPPVVGCPPRCATSSRAASFLTGVVVPVDGGRAARGSDLEES